MIQLLPNNIWSHSTGTSLCGHLIHLPAVVWEPNQEDGDPLESPMGSCQRVYGTACCQGRWDLQRAQSQARSGLPVKDTFWMLGLKDALKIAVEFSSCCVLAPRR